MKIFLSDLRAGLVAFIVGIIVIIISQKYDMSSLTIILAILVGLYVLVFIGYQINKRTIGKEKDASGVSDYTFNELNKEALAKWCNVWGKIYDHLNRIALYIYPPQSEIRYALYFEFDVFTKEGRKQSEAFNQGTWNQEHFPIDDAEKFKSVYNEKPKDSTYITEWNFFSNARNANKDTPKGVPSIEIYKKQKPNPLQITPPDPISLRSIGLVSSVLCE